MISIELAAVRVWWSRDPSDHHPSLMPRPTHALTLRCTVFFFFTLDVTLHFATCSLCSLYTAHFCAFAPFAKQWSAVFCIALLWRLFCCHHSLRWQGVVQCTVDVVCTVWEQGLIPSAQCTVDETQVLSLNRATWPDHLVSDQTVVILKQKQKQNFNKAKTNAPIVYNRVLCWDRIGDLYFLHSCRLTKKNIQVMVNDHW